jgi:hypothetical protein
MYSNGIPHIMRMRKYGTKNTPGIEKDIQTQIIG